MARKPRSAPTALGGHVQATETPPQTSNRDAPRPDRPRSALRWLRRGSETGTQRRELTHGRRELIGLPDNGFHPVVFQAACPNLQLRDDQSTSAPYVTAAHRCACAPGYAPDSVHQIAFCLTGSAHTSCPRFVTPATPREVDDGALPPPPAREAVQQRRRRPFAAAAAALAAIARAALAVVALPPAGDQVPPRVAAPGESAAVTPEAAALVIESPERSQVSEAEPSLAPRRKLPVGD